MIFTVQQGGPKREIFRIPALYLGSLRSSSELYRRICHALATFEAYFTLTTYKMSQSPKKSVDIIRTNLENKRWRSPESSMDR